MTKNHITFQKLPPALWIGMGIYGVIFILLTGWKLSHFYYDNLDLAIFNQVFFNTLHGSPFAATIHPPSYLGDHFSPLVFLLLPFYAAAPGPHVLLIIETLAIALTAIPIFCIARKLLPDAKPWLPLFAAFLWLLNPQVHNMNFFEFALTPFAVLFLFWMYYGYLTRNTMLYMVMALLALSAREDVSLIIIAFGILAFFQKRESFWKWFPIVLGIVWLASSFYIIGHYAPAQSYKFLVYYGWLGGTTVPTVIASFLSHPLRVLQNLLTYTNIEMVLALTFPFLFIVFRRSLAWLLLIAPAAQIMLGEGGGGSIIFMTHHAGFFLFGLFILAIEALRAVEYDITPRLLRYLPNRATVYALIGAASVYAAVTYGSIVPAVRAWSTPNQESTKAALVEKIPADAPVAATYELLTPLSGRSKIYGLNYALLGKTQFGLTDYTLPNDTEYLAIDWNDVLKNYVHMSAHPRYRDYAPRFTDALREILSDFKIIAADGSLMLLQRGAGVPVDSLLSSMNASEATGTSDPLLTALRYENGAGQLDIVLPAGNFDQLNYYLGATSDRRSFLLPLGYFLLDEADADRTLTMPIFISEAELPSLTVRLFHWASGSLRLGHLKNLELTTDAKEIGRLP